MTSPVTPEQHAAQAEDYLTQAKAVLDAGARTDFLQAAIAHSNLAVFGRTSQVRDLTQVQVENHNSPYTPNIMLDVPAGIMVNNAATAPGTEVYAGTVSTRYVVDWASVTQRVTHTRIQVVAKSSGASPPVYVKVRDVTNGVDVDTVEIAGTTPLLVAGLWAPYVTPTTPTTYAVFVQGNATLDPTVYSVLWEWR